MHVVQFLGACMHPGCTMLITELMAANAQDLVHSGQLPWRDKCAPLWFQGHPAVNLRAFWCSSGLSVPTARLHDSTCCTAHHVTGFPRLPSSITSRWNIQAFCGSGLVLGGLPAGLWNLPCVLYYSLCPL